MGEESYQIARVPTITAGIIDCPMAGLMTKPMA